MKRVAWPIVLVAVAIVFYLARQSRPRGEYGGGAANTIDYQGVEFKLKKAYSTWDAYKDDPNNLDTNELERIERVMVEARFPSSFTSYREFVHALFKLKFPGYGLGGTGEQAVTDDGSVLYVQSVEIPQRGKERYLTARQSSDGSIVVLDDFVASTATNVIKRVKLQSGKLMYYDTRGCLVREKDVVTR